MFKYNEQVIPFINELKEFAIENNLKYLYAYGGSIYRAANNRESVLDMIKKNTGLSVKIISPAEEGLINFYGYHYMSHTLNQTINENEVVLFFEFGSGSVRLSIFNHNNELIWEIVPELEFEIQYIDSSFVIADSISPSRFISLQKINGDSSKILEYIILDTIPFAISRLHDRGPWYHSKETTFGSSNENIKNSYDTKLMPQLFVLYQNYPNPFNGKTRITFDLLEDALVTLYVTDATGRIHDRLIEGEYVTSGSYNYLWDGESRSSGIYFITIQAEVNQALPAIFSRKMIYIK